MKDKLNQLQTALASLKTKLTQFKNTKQTALTQSQAQNDKLQNSLNEANHKLELSTKENSENEKVLEQLLKEFKELENELG